MPGSWWVRYICKRFWGEWLMLIGVWRNARIHGVPAEYCTVSRWSVLFISAVSVVLMLWLLVSSRIFGWTWFDCNQIQLNSLATVRSPVNVAHWLSFLSSSSHWNSDWWCTAREKRYPLMTQTLHEASYSIWFGLCSRTLKCPAGSADFSNAAVFLKL